MLIQYLLKLFVYITFNAMKVQFHYMYISNTSAWRSPRNRSWLNNYQSISQIVFDITTGFVYNIEFQRADNIISGLLAFIGAV